VDAKTASLVDIELRLQPSTSNDLAF